MKSRAYLFRALMRGEIYPEEYGRGVWEMKEWELGKFRSGRTPNEREEEEMAENILEKLING